MKRRERRIVRELPPPKTAMHSSLHAAFGNRRVNETTPLFICVSPCIVGVLFSPRAVLKKKRTVKTLAICVSVLIPSLIVTTPGLIARAANPPAQGNEPVQGLQAVPTYDWAPTHNP